MKLSNGKYQCENCEQIFEYEDMYDDRICLSCMGEFEQMQYEYDVEQGLFDDCL